MIWLLPAAWLGAAAVAVPIVIHLLARRRAVLQPFPTLRFIPTAALTALPRRAVDELLLLVVRCAIVLAAVAAIAGPIVLTRARRDAWNGRTTREILDRPEGLRPGDLARAAEKLDAAPPGRREIVVRSSFPIGSLTDADIAAVPRAVGLRFERSGSLPATRTVAAAAVLAGGRERAASVERLVTLDGPRTSVADATFTPASAPIDVAAPETSRSAIAAVLAERVLAAPSGRRVRLLVAGASGFTEKIREARRVAMPWIADAVARISRQRELRDAALRVDRPLEGPALSQAPWQIVAANREGKPVVSAAADASGNVLIASAAPADDLTTALLIRAALEAIAPVPAPTGEIVTIPDVQLKRWSREPGEAAPPRRDTVDADDRRVLWVLALALLGVEGWMRRTGR